MVTMTQIPKGYKQTDIGVIPEDWNIKKLAEVANVKTGPFGSSLHERDYVQDGTPIITVEHLGERGIVHENLPMVSDLDKRRLISYILKTDDIVFSRVGSVDRNSLVTEKEHGWLFSGRLLRIRLDSRKISPAYLSYYFHQEPTKQRVRSVAVGQTMASLNTQILKNIAISLPQEKTEQSLIATILSETDELIESLVKLLAKKKAIKQAAMHELLTGKRRLPGFNGEWEEKKLGEIFTISAGRDLVKEDFSPLKDDEHRIPIYSNALEESGLYGFTKNPRHDKNSITITARGTIGKANARDHTFDAIGRLLILSPKAKLNCLYMAEYLNNRVEFSIESTGVPQLTAPQASTYLVSYPEKNEQDAIANVLSDMEEEILILEEQRDKYKALKQGMMQQLLTGRIRLV